MNNKSKKSILQFIETVSCVESTNVKRSSSKYYKKPIWKLQCEAREMIVLIEKLQDNYFLEMIKKNEVVGKTFVFEIFRKGRFVISAKILSTKF